MQEAPVTLEHYSNSSKMLASNSSCGTANDDSSNVKIPDTQNRLCCIVQAAQPSTRTWLEIELDNMQNAIVSQLFNLLKENGITLEDRIAIGVSSIGKLEIYGHPQRSEIMQLLENNHIIHKELCLMAVMTLTERGLGDLAMAGDMLKGDSAEERKIFQACLKGALAHFHLIN